MKTLRFLSVLVCLLAISAGFVSCSDDEGGDGNLLVGTWEATRYEGYRYSNGEREEYNEPGDGRRITFNEDGTGAGDGEYFDWSLSNNLLTLTGDGGSDVYTVASLTSTELVVELVDLDDFDRTYYRRVN